MNSKKSRNIIKLLFLKCKISRSNSEFTQFSMAFTAGTTPLENLRITEKNASENLFRVSNITYKFFTASIVSIDKLPLICH